MTFLIYLKDDYEPIYEGSFKLIFLEGCEISSQECTSFNKLMKSEVYKSHFLIKSTEKAKPDDVRIIVRLTFKTKPDKVVFPEQI